MPFPIEQAMFANPFRIALLPFWGNASARPVFLVSAIFFNEATLASHWSLDSIEARQGMPAR
jgi:hypothetical protein